MFSKLLGDHALNDFRLEVEKRNRSIVVHIVDTKIRFLQEGSEFTIEAIWALRTSTNFKLSTFSSKQSLGLDRGRKICRDTPL